MRSGLVSNTGGLTPGGNGTTSSAPTPGSRNGRATPGSTPKNTPSGAEVALASLMKPPTGATTSSCAAATRMPSSRSRVAIGLSAFTSAAVSTNGVGSALPVESCDTVAPVISVMVSWCGLDEVTYSET